MRLTASEVSRGRTAPPWSRRAPARATGACSRPVVTRPPRHAARSSGPTLRRTAGRIPWIAVWVQLRGIRSWAGCRRRSEGEQIRLRFGPCPEGVATQFVVDPDDLPAWLLLEGPADDVALPPTSGQRVGCGRSHRRMRGAGGDGARQPLVLVGPGDPELGETEQLAELAVGVVAPGGQPLELDETLHVQAEEPFDDGRSPRDRPARTVGGRVAPSPVIPGGEWGLPCSSHLLVNGSASLQRVRASVTRRLQREDAGAGRRRSPPARTRSLPGADDVFIGASAEPRRQLCDWSLRRCTGWTRPGRRPRRAGR